MNPTVPGWHHVHLVNILRRDVDQVHAKMFDDRIDSDNEKTNGNVERAPTKTPGMLHQEGYTLRTVEGLGIEYRACSGVVAYILTMYL